MRSSFLRSNDYSIERTIAQQTIERVALPRMTTEMNTSRAAASGLSARVIRGWPDFSKRRARWVNILSTCQHNVRGPDATCAPVWAQGLAETRLKNAEVITLEVTNGGELVAIIPTYFATEPRFPLGRRILRVVTEASGGRRGLVVVNDDPIVLEFALRAIKESFPPWHLLVMGTVANSRLHESIVGATRALNLTTRCLSVGESPYIVLGDDWDAVAASLPKKMRWTIRKSEKELSARHRLEYAEIRGSPGVHGLLESMFTIERRSWKEESGSSITYRDWEKAFYERFVELSACDGILSGHVLYADGRPIAYILGVEAGDGVFLDLKESFDAAYAEFSPGHVLKRFVITSLVERGVRHYDFMGNCEPYKMRWTDRTYQTLTIAIYPNNFKGRVGLLRSMLGGRSTPTPVPGPASA